MDCDTQCPICVSQPLRLIHIIPFINLAVEYNIQHVSQSIITINVGNPIINLPFGDALYAPNYGDFGDGLLGLPHYGW